MVHTSALPSDILTCIFDHIHRKTDVDGVSLPLDYEVRRDIYNAALVNRAFADVALPILWSRVTSFSPLFLASGLVSISQLDTHVDMGVSRFAFYAQMVRHAFCVLNVKREAHMLQRLVDFSPTSSEGLLPNLQSLQFDIGESTSLTLVNALLTSSITRIHAQWHSTPRLDPVSLQGQQEAVLQAIVTRTPYIKDLAIRRNELYPTDMATLQPYIICLAGMTSLSLDPGPEALESGLTRAVLALPCLLYLHISQKLRPVAYAWAFTLRSDGRGLRHLSYLSVQHDCVQLPETFANLLYIGCIESIEHLSLRVLPQRDANGFSSQSLPQGHHWERIWSAIGTVVGANYATSLRSLHLSFKIWNQHDLSSVMNPFKALSSLESYECSVDHILYVPTVGLEHSELAYHLWPCLRHLGVDARPQGRYGMEHIPEFVQPIANLTSIRAICFNLGYYQRLSEEVKATYVPLPLIKNIQLGGIMIGHKNRIIRFNTLDPSHGPFVTPASVIDFLLTYFPNAENIELRGMSQIEIHDLVDGIRRVRAELSKDATEGTPTADDQTADIFVLREPGSGTLRACVLLDNEELWAIDDTRVAEDTVRMFPDGRIMRIPNGSPRRKVHDPSILKFLKEWNEMLVTVSRVRKFKQFKETIDTLLIKKRLTLKQMSADVVIQIKSVFAQLKTHKPTLREFEVSSIGGVILHVALCMRKRRGMHCFKVQAQEIILAWRSDLEQVKRNWGPYAARYQGLDKV